MREKIKQLEKEIVEEIRKATSDLLDQVLIALHFGSYRLGEHDSADLAMKMLKENGKNDGKEHPYIMFHRGYFMKDNNHLAAADICFNLVKEEFRYSHPEISKMVAELIDYHKAA